MMSRGASWPGSWTIFERPWIAWVTFVDVRERRPLRCRNILAQTPERLHYRTRTMPLIREEMPADHDAIRQVNRIAFGGNDEASIVDRLRSAGIVIVSLVAIENDQFVGHIMFSQLPIETDQ